MRANQQTNPPPVISYATSFANNAPSKPAALRATPLTAAPKIASPVSAGIKPAAGIVNSAVPKGAASNIVKPVVTAPSSGAGSSSTAVPSRSMGPASSARARELHKLQRHRQHRMRRNRQRQVQPQ